VIEPILNPIWVLLVLGERPGPLSLLGGVVVLSAVTLRMLYSLRAAPPAAPYGDRKLKREDARSDR
jgi:hypothetical protein